MAAKLKLKPCFGQTSQYFNKYLEKYGELTFAQKTIIESLTEVVDFKLFEEENEAEIE